MPATARPFFYEDQVVRPDHLNALADAPRDDLARHARHAHTWGIVDGLDLTVESADRLFVEPGLAVTSAGAALVVPARRLVSKSQFTTQVASPDAGMYPVYLVLKPRDAAAPVGQPCGPRPSADASPDAPDVRFGRLTEQPSGEPKVGFGDAADDKGSDRRVLLGYVEWINHGFKPVPSAGAPVPRRLAGVRAGEVTGVGGRVVLRGADAGTKDAFLLAAGGDGKFVFQVAQDDGKGLPSEEKWLLRIDKDGNLTTKGAVNPTTAVQPGQSYVQSGTASDGATIPLPGNLVAADVPTKATVHVLLTPRPDLSAAPPGAGAAWVAVPLTCRVVEGRRVECTMAWVNTAGAGRKFAPGVCDYLIHALGK